MADKALRRKKRREKELARERDYKRGVERIKKILAAPGSFNNFKGDYRRAILDLYHRAKGEYPTLVDVFEIDPNLDLPDQELLNHCGLGDRYKTHFFQTPTNDGYTSFKPAVSGDLPLGGVTQVVIDGAGQYATLIFMKRSNEVSDMCNIALFLHELGHVDDFHNGINWAVGRDIDTELLELHAHEFACKRMMAGHYLLPLDFYLSFSIEQLEKAAVASISRAAARFRESQTYQESTKFLGPLKGKFRAGYDNRQSA